MSAEPILVVGGDGAIGQALTAALAASGTPVHATTRRPAHVGEGRPFLDLAATAGWTELPAASAAVIAASQASIQACEADPAGTRAVNVTATIELVKHLRARGTHVSFLSTNLVFDGERDQVTADAPWSPRTEYGRQKADVEAALLEMGGGTAVIRLSKVVGGDARLFQDWADRLRAGQTVEAFGDMVMSPLALGEVTGMLSEVAKAAGEGIYQYSARDDISYADAARYLADKLDGAGKVRETAASDAGIDTNAMPAHTTMDSDRLFKEFSVTSPAPWRALDQFLG